MRRFVVTRRELVGGKVVPVKGHWIGPGEKSVLTVHRKIGKDALRRALKTFKYRKANNLCPFCGAPVDPDTFRDDLSKREFAISGLCQKCQDEAFAEPADV